MIIKMKLNGNIFINWKPQNIESVLCHAYDLHCEKKMFKFLALNVSAYSRGNDSYPLAPQIFVKKYIFRGVCDSGQTVKDNNVWFEMLCR